MKPPLRHRNITVKRLLLDVFRFLRCQSWFCHRLGYPYQPSREYVEIDITYKCNLKCINCNRSCTQAPSELEMPVPTIETFIARKIPWKRIRILGGEPTLHSLFFDIVDRLMDYGRGQDPSVRLVVGTNFYGRRVRRALEQLPPSIAIKSSLKTSGKNLFRPFNVASVDTRYNRFSDYHCGCRIIEECGLGLMPTGYYMCAVAGGIDRTFGYRLGRPDLPDHSNDFTDQMAASCPLCGHFGFQWPTRKSRQSKTRRLAYAAAASQMKKKHKGEHDCR
ncbi:hypothetical protein [uncultured Desulfosarcina sp.]|uniref:radical SAM protein n=1 Tax=uncultured Desulfosarcina sp. TaxID=218289 RepID=UPI0029C78638|nr:hypothetical protein [uncultured Desulfosarcina sp.]